MEGLSMSYGKYDNIHAMMDFTEVMKKEKEKAARKRAMKKSRY